MGAMQKTVLDVGSEEGIVSNMIRKNITANMDMLYVSIDSLKIFGKEGI